MKKSLMVLIVFAVCCFANPAFAASNTFNDVPTNHWAYAALNKLAQAGIVNGYNGSYFGDRTLTRYEMAVMVANAMTKEDKADAENKVLIDKLAAEFSGELQKLDVRLSNVEKKQGPLKITGFFTYRNEWVQHPMSGSLSNIHPNQDNLRNGIADSSNTNRTAIWLYVDNQFDGNTYFHGLLQNESIGGRSTDATINLLEGYAAAKVGDAEVAVGRFFPSIGMGFFGSPWMDGGRISFGKDVKVRLFSTKLITNPATYGSAMYNMADVKFSLNKNTDMSLGYVASTRPSDAYNADSANNSYFDKKYYKDYAVGVEYKGIRNISLKSEYAINSSEWAKSQNDNSAAKAYFVTLKYKGANPFVAKTFGLRAEYKHADPGFDYLNYTTPFEWTSPANWNQPTQGGYNDNIKGWEFGIEYTVAPRMLLEVKTNILKTANGKAIDSVDGKSYTSQNFTIAQLTYFF